MTDQTGSPLVDAKVPSRSMGWRIARLGLAAFAALGLAFMGVGCLSMDKPDIEAALLSLDKNSMMREVGLRRTSFAFGEDGTVVEGTYFLQTAIRPIENRMPVVLVHGTPSSLFNWAPILGAQGESVLHEERDVYALDVVGHGVSTADQSTHSFRACASYVLAFVEALGLSNVCLVGNSYGGEMVWQAALDRPDLVGRLVLIDSSGYQRTEEEFLPEERAMRELSVAKYGWLLNSRDRILSALQPHFGNAVAADSLEEMFLVCQNADNWGAMVDLARDENGERAAELRNLDQPTLLLWGDRDIAYPVETFGQRFLEDLPNAELQVVPDCGHYPHEERPDLVIRHILDFLELRG